MKVAICCLNSKYIHASLAPWCLAAGAKQFAKNENDIIVLESTINSDISLFADEIVKQRPDILTFSFYIWNIKQTLAVCRSVKEHLPNCCIVAGGPEVAYRAADVLKRYSYIDYVLSGEGEFSFPPLLDFLNAGGDINRIDGLTYRLKDAFISIPEAEYSDTPPSPYSKDFFENLKGRICYIESSRGCPYRCAFCLSGRCSKLRFFDIAQVKNDIIRLANSGTQTIKFVDRTFNANPKHANEILSFIKHNYGVNIPQGVTFHFEIAGDILTEQTLNILSSMPSGSIQLEIGMQSFNPDTLRSINRTTDISRLITNIQKLISMGNMHIHIDLIAGLPNEDLKSFENSFNIGYSLGAHMLQMGFLKLLYGADMREEPQKYPCSYSEEPPYEVTSTPWLSSDEIVMLKNCEDAVERLYNSGRFLFTLDYLINDIGFKPFTLFCDFGNTVSGTKMSLIEYTEKIFDFFKDKCDPELLREKLICDILSSSATTQFPEKLKTYHPLYKKIKRIFSKKGSYKITILPYSNLIFAVNQNEKKDFHGRLPCEFYPLDEATNI